MSILVDTGAFYALADDSDRNAAAARAFFKSRLGQDRFVTTSAVVLETWTLLRNKLGWDAARRFLEGVKASGMTVHFVGEADLEAARRILDQYADQELSLTDAASFCLMERHGLTEVFTFDKDFLVYRYGPGNRRSFSCHPD